MYGLCFINVLLFGKKKTSYLLVVPVCSKPACALHILHDAVSVGVELQRRSTLTLIKKATRILNNGVI